MKLSAISGVVFYAKDLEKTAEFYENLGFRFGKNVSPEQLTCYVNWFWLIFNREEKEEGPNARKATYRNNRGSGTYLYIKVDDIDEYYNGLVEKGFTPLSEPTKMPSGNREFMIRDPDGYNLVFFWKK
jgi:catechol 2,3-dioxygenase-like lactoylglutathione lyase family enzyme